jgi:hypothetical protein
VDIRFTVGTSCERVAPLAEKNAAARHHVLRSPISLHDEHPVYIFINVYSRCYATILRWSVISDPFPGNGSVNTFPQQRLHMQRWKRGVVYAVRDEEIKEENWGNQFS